MTELHRNLITGKDAIAKVVLGGKSFFTLVSKGTGKRYTYKFAAPKSQLKDGNTDFDVIFVAVLTGPDNTTNYSYVGQIFPQRTGLQYNHGRKARQRAEAPSVKAIKWFLDQLNGNGTHLDKVEFWQEGKCARCGRKLTVDDSVAAGFGPDCAGMMNVPYGRPKPGKVAEGTTSMEEGAKVEAEMHEAEAEADREQTERDEAAKFAARKAMEQTTKLRLVEDVSEAPDEDISEAGGNLDMFRDNFKG